MLWPEGTQGTHFGRSSPWPTHVNRCSLFVQYNWVYCFNVGGGFSANPPLFLGFIFSISMELRFTDYWGKTVALFSGYITSGPALFEDFSPLQRQGRAKTGHAQGLPRAFLWLSQFMPGQRPNLFRLISLYKALHYPHSFTGYSQNE